MRSSGRAPCPVDDPFSLICHAYLILQGYGDPDFTFDNLCDYLDRLSDKVTEGETSTGTFRAEIPSGGARRSKRQKKEVVYTEGEGWVNPPDNIDKLGEKWDNALSIYKEWLEVTDPGQYRSLIEKTMTSTESYKQPEAAEYTPFGDESKDVYAITYLIPYSDGARAPEARGMERLGREGQKTGVDGVDYQWYY